MGKERAPRVEVGALGEGWWWSGCCCEELFCSAGGVAKGSLLPGGDDGESGEEIDVVVVLVREPRREHERMCAAPSSFVLDPNAFVVLVEVLIEEWYEFLVGLVGGEEGADEGVLVHGVMMVVLIPDVEDSCMTALPVAGSMEQRTFLPPWRRNSMAAPFSKRSRWLLREMRMVAGSGPVMGWCVCILRQQEHLSAHANSQVNLRR